MRSVLERCQQSHSGPKKASLLGSVFQNVLGTLRSNDAEDKENVKKKTMGLISKTTTSRVRHPFFVHFFPVFVSSKNIFIGILVQETVVFLVQKVPLIGCSTTGKELVFLLHKVL